MWNDILALPGLLRRLCLRKIFILYTFVVPWFVDKYILWLGHPVIFTTTIMQNVFSSNIVSRSRLIANHNIESLDADDQCADVLRLACPAAHCYGGCQMSCAYVICLENVEVRKWLIFYKCSLFDFLSLGGVLYSRVSIRSNTFSMAAHKPTIPSSRPCWLYHQFSTSRRLLDSFINTCYSVISHVVPLCDVSKKTLLYAHHGEIALKWWTKR